MFSLSVIRAMKRTRSLQAGKHLSQGKFVGVGVALSQPLKEREEGYFEDWGYKVSMGIFISLPSSNPHICDHCRLI